MEVSKLYHPLQIGSLNLEGNLFLAPLAGFTDKAFRSMALDYGANLTFSEMVSCEAIARGNKKTITLMERTGGEDLFAIQIFAGEVDPLQRSLEGVVAAKPSLIDLNCGCPVPKVVKTGAGSALMKDPEKIHSMVVLMKSTGLPVSVKIRSGWDHPSTNYLEVARAIEEGGADMITLHPRTRSQGYSGKSDWSHLKELKKNMSIPVIGSGDLFTPEDVKNMLLETGIDGVMFARGALGNPFIFEQTRSLLISDNYNDVPDYKERIEGAKRHFHRALEYYDEKKVCKEIRKHLCSYTKGLPGSSDLRNKVITCTSREEYDGEFSLYLERLNRDQA